MISHLLLKTMSVTLDTETAMQPVCGTVAVDRERVLAARDRLLDQLRQSRGLNGEWTGHLSNSALSTATAISAISFFNQGAPQAGVSQSVQGEAKVRRGLDWLAAHQNSDGGWGDTPECYSNISTSLLVTAAARASNCDGSWLERISAAEEYVAKKGGVAGLRDRYGQDRTFSVPILANAAMAGIVGWHEVSALPFEAACVPQRFYNLLNLPVVSYAIPALVAIGLVKFHNDPPRNPLVRLVRMLCSAQSLRVLERIQPSSGGFLEAIPLTSFVAMGLIKSGRRNHPVVKRAIKFLLESSREEGSWPIDTNLAIWNTTLTINAIGQDWPKDWRTEADWLPTLNWLLSCQNTTVHPYTGAAPGGWGWSDLSGAVPDADDTPGAMLSLKQLMLNVNCNPPTVERMKTSTRLGAKWLLGLQNRDGGWPTFCKGWGRLPFDRSGSDITAHAIRGLWAWRSELADLPIDRAIERGLRFIEQTQNSDGSWNPLWFGNQDNPDDVNPCYGTAKVLLAYRDLGMFDTPAARNGLNWVVKSQHSNGGWGGGKSIERNNPELGCGTIEETALCLEALLASDLMTNGTAIEQGLAWLLSAIEQGEVAKSRPIGLYFARLWYDERHYPVVFALSALGSALQRLK
jgi:squalene-hopene/tetraprenyl-beta-curcumene cyclase